MRSVTRYSLALLSALTTTSAIVSAQTRTYVPTPSSSAQAPVLHLKSGDRLKTSTIDDKQLDAKGNLLGKGSNPRTGPFYIDGAEPGDMLVVTLDTLDPIGTTGVSTFVVSSNAVSPESLQKVRSVSYVSWTIDKAAQMVRLDLPTAIPGTDWAGRFRPPTFELPLRPMLALMSVATSASGEGTSGASGPFGGDLNFTGLEAGARVMLPVSVSGALLSLGRGQARQGDGNITGGGIETTLNVQFSVEVVKKKEWPHSTVARASTIAGEFPIEWPRVETQTSLTTVGSGATLLDALKTATLELHHWVDDDFGLSERSVSILFGQGIEYEIAGLAGPEFTVAARTAKSALPKPAPAQ